MDLMNSNVTLAKESPVSVHPWHHCHNCGAAPITGKRFQCDSCPIGPENDLCDSCYELLKNGKIKHPKEGAAHSSVIKDHVFSVHVGRPITDFDEWFRVNHSPAKVPWLPSMFIVRPIFTAGYDSSIGGYGFVVHSPIPGPKGEQILFITALHVMDEIIKLKKIDSSDRNKNYSGRELPAMITEVSLFNVFSSNWMMNFLANAGPMLVLPNARTEDEEPYSDRDMAAFWVKDKGDLIPAKLAGEQPKKGDVIWQATRSEDGWGMKLFKGVVAEITERSMVFIYEDASEKPKYTSGSPMINVNGEVVGIVVGGGCLKNERLGHANHVGNIRRHLASALR